MPFLTITETKLATHMNDHWSLYASEVRNDTLCRIWFNGNGTVKVVIEDKNQFDIKYLGRDLGKAVEVFNQLS